MGGFTISYGSIFGFGAVAGLGLALSLAILAGIVGGIMYLCRGRK